jgi:hypothetical protein
MKFEVFARSSRSLSPVAAPNRGAAPPPPGTLTPGTLTQGELRRIVADLLG